MHVIQPVLEVIVFAIVVLVCFYLPGKLLSIVLKFKLRFLEDIFFSTTLGIMVFTLIAYVFSWLRIEVLLLPALLGIGIFTIRGKGWLPSKFEAKDRLPFLLIALFASLFSLTMVTSGQFGNTIRLLGVNGHDGLWYLALINELKAHFPPEYPGFAGVAFKGYHFFYFFVLAKISNIFQLPPLALFLHFFPVLVAMLWAIGVYVLMYRWSNDRNVGLWAVFLTMFGGSFAFILPIQGHTGLSLDSAFGMSQAAPSLLNPPYAISIVIIVAVLFALHQYFAERNNRWLIPIILFVGLVSMFKVYAGMILLGAFLLLALIDIVVKRRFTLLWVLVAIGILFLTTYWVFTDRTARLIFHPLWAPHKVLEDNIKWYGYAEKQYTYSRLSVIRGLIAIEIDALLIFLLGNLGTRLIGLIFLFLFFIRKRAHPSHFAFAVLIMTGIAITVPLFFIQSGRVFEIIQLTWYFLFFCSLFAALGLGALFRLRLHKILKVVFFLMIVGATLPSPYETLKGFILIPNGVMSKSYYDATQFLKSQDTYDATVLVMPEQHVQPTEEKLRRWYRYTRPDIIAFTNKRSYLTYQYFDFPGIDITPRINFLQKVILFTQTPEKNSQYQSRRQDVERGLVDNNIYYIYSSYALPSFGKLSNVVQIYHNEGATIYKVTR